MNGVAGRARRPVLRSKIHTPKMRAGRMKFNSNARALLRRVSHVNDAAFLLFFRHRIDQRQVRAQLERFVQIEQPAVRVDDNGLAVLAELASLHVLARSAHRYAREHARTAPLVAG